MAIVTHSFTLRYESTPQYETGAVQVIWGSEFVASRPVKKEKLFYSKFRIERLPRKDHSFFLEYRIGLDKTNLEFFLPYLSNTRKIEKRVSFSLGYNIDLTRRRDKQFFLQSKIFTDSYSDISRPAKSFLMKYRNDIVSRKNKNFYLPFNIDKILSSEKHFVFENEIDTSYPVETEVVYFTSADGVPSAGYKFNGLDSGLYVDADVSSGAGAWTPFTVYALISNGSNYVCHLAEFPLLTRPVNGQNIEDINCSHLNPAYRIYLSITNIGDYRSSIFIPYVDDQSSLSVKPFSSLEGS